MSDKYKNGKIYTIRYEHDDPLIYVGSTVQPLFKRWHQHKKKFNNEKYNNILLYQKIRETKIEDWYIELYEDFSTERKEQLNKREGEVIREIGTLNKQIPGRTPNEWYEDNRNKILEKKKENYEANRNKILEKKKENYEANKDTVSEKNKVYIRMYMYVYKRKHARARARTHTHTHTHMIKYMPKSQRKLLFENLKLLLHVAL